jgi:hypothetical protein
MIFGKKNQLFFNEHNLQMNLNVKIYKSVKTGEFDRFFWS